MGLDTKTLEELELLAKNLRQQITLHLATPSWKGPNCETWRSGLRCAAATEKISELRLLKASPTECLCVLRDHRWGAGADPAEAGMPQYVASPSSGPIHRATNSPANGSHTTRTSSRVNGSMLSLQSTSIPITSGRPQMVLGWDIRAATGGIFLPPFLAAVRYLKFAGTQGLGSRTAVTFACERTNISTSATRSNVRSRYPAPNHERERIRLANELYAARNRKAGTGTKGMGPGRSGCVAACRGCSAMTCYCYFPEEVKPRCMPSRQWAARVAKFAS